MDSYEDKLVKKYLLDELTAPEPSLKDEPGEPGTYHNKTLSRPRLSSSLSHDSATARRAGDGNNRTSQPAPPAYTLPYHNGSPNSDRHSQRRSIGQGSLLISPSTAQIPSNRVSTDRASSAIPTSPTGQSSLFSDVGSSGSRSQRQGTAQASSAIPTSPSNRRRNNSLVSRFEGDRSHRPLEIIKRDTLLANRAPHLRKEHHVGPDTIDSLDTVGGAYHHAGPYDATLLARNTAVDSSPVAAVRESNIAALKATPREMIRDSLRAHRPLDGVALVPPGVSDPNGQVYDYEEKNLIIEGDYKRWPGITYLPEDLKGKGEPSYSLEKALKEKEKRNSHRRVFSEGGEAGIPLLPERARPSSSGPDSRFASADGVGERYTDWEETLRRTSMDRRSSGGFLRKKIGGVRSRNHD